MAKRNVSEIESGVGFFMGFANAIMDVVREKSYPFEAIYRLVTPGGRTTLAKMVDLAHTDWQAEQSISANPKPETKVEGNELGKDEYLVPVAYSALPSFAELEQEFGKGNVSDLFDGHHFEKHASCVNEDETPGDKIFLVKHFNQEIKSEAAIAEMDKRGYRPATHIEAYAFQRKNPELQCEFWIIALGSFAVRDVRRFVAVLRGGSDGRFFGCRWFGSVWSSDYRFLFVRK